MWVISGSVSSTAAPPSELDYAIRALSANGAASLVFDLRDNGGGVLDDAISCINLIAPEGTVASRRG